jgi:hypothetical protein
MNKRDTEFIQIFLQHLSYVEGRLISLQQIPDLVERNVQAIDAATEEHAIEHVSFDSLPQLREKTASFSAVIGEIESEFAECIPFDLRIGIRYEAVTKGQVWQELNAAFKNWIMQISPFLEYGMHEIDKVKGIPFPYRVDKSPASAGSVSFYRLTKDDETLIERLRQKVEEKAKKLRSSKWDSKKRVLLIETPDILMSHVCVWKALREGFPPSGLPEGVDEVWHVGTFHNVIFAMLAPQLGNPGPIYRKH